MLLVHRLAFPLQQVHQQAYRRQVHHRPSGSMAPQLAPEPQQEQVHHLQHQPRLPLPRS